MRRQWQVRRNRARFTGALNFSAACGRDGYRGSAVAFVLIVATALALYLCYRLASPLSV